MMKDGRRELQFAGKGTGSKKMRYSFFAKTGIITGLIIFGVFASGIAVKKYNEKKSIRNFEATVSKVVDGDTVILEDGQKVRLLGIDTPETNHPDRPVERYGIKAKEYMKKRVEGKKCVLEYTLNDNYDKYDRLLALLYLDGILINAEMVKKGLAYASPNKYMSITKEFMVLENIAKKFKMGIWETEEGGQVKK